MARLISPVLLTALLLFTGCAGDQNEANYDVETVRTDVEATNERFERYVADQQYDSLMTLYTEDAMMLPQGAPTAEGDAIRRGFEQMSQMGVSSIDLELVDLEVAGNTAYEVGNYTLQGQNGMEIDKGKYLVVWKNVDGEWKLHRDIFNSNQPMQSRDIPSDTTMADTTMVDTTAAL